MALFCYASKYPIKHKLMSDNHTRQFHRKLFHHIRWHVAAKSGTQGISQFQSKCKENASKPLVARFLKTLHIYSAGSPFLYYQGEDLPKWNMPQSFFISFTLSSQLLPCPVPPTPTYSINSFGSTDSCTGIELFLCLAVFTSSDKCPWPLWNSINPAQSFPQRECTVSHVCYSWHAEQQGLLTSN